MKATDLMIGDWVSVYIEDDDPAQCGYVTCKVENINDFGDIGVKCNDYREENVEPIPLTPEILEKNGFVYADLPFEDFYEGYGLHIHGGNYADGHSNWYIICGINVSMNVTHVHELQHALRLCGIEKEIVL